MSNFSFNLVFHEHLSVWRVEGLIVSNRHRLNLFLITVCSEISLSEIKLQGNMFFLRSILFVRAHV